MTKLHSNLGIIGIRTIFNDKEGNILFNDALNTSYLRLHGIGHMVNDHSYSKIGKLLLPHGLLFLISSKDSFICIIPHRITHTTAFVIPKVEHWLEQEITQLFHHEGSIRRPITPWATSRSFFSEKNPMAHRLPQTSDQPSICLVLSPPAYVPC